MATNNCFKANITNHHSLRRRHSIDYPPSTSTLLKKPNHTTTFCNSNVTQVKFCSNDINTTLCNSDVTQAKFYSSATSTTIRSRLITCNSLSSTTTSTTLTTSPLSQAITYDLLEQLLAAKNFRQADDETRRLLIALAGEGAQKRGYVFFSEVQFLPEDDLKTIDGLWRKYSDNKFGYSVQKKVFDKVDRDFSRLFIKLGWMKKLDTEVEQHNYRAFPGEFIWELNDDTPQGHLPLTNALRGTQLMTCILKHPAFEDEDSGDGDGDSGETNATISASKPFSKNVFKTDYSF